MTYKELLSVCIIKIGESDERYHYYGNIADSMNAHTAGKGTETCDTVANYAACLGNKFIKPNGMAVRHPYDALKKLRHLIPLLKATGVWNDPSVNPDLIALPAPRTKIQSKSKKRIHSVGVSDAADRDILRRCLDALMYNSPTRYTVYDIEIKTGIHHTTINKILMADKHYSIGKAITKMEGLLVATHIWNSPDNLADLERIIQTYPINSKNISRIPNSRDLAKKTVVLKDDLVMSVKARRANMKSIQTLRNLYNSNHVEGIHINNAKVKQALAGSMYYYWGNGPCTVTIREGTTVEHHVDPKRNYHSITILKSTRAKPRWQGLVFEGKVWNPRVLGLPATFPSEFGISGSMPEEPL